MEILGKIVIILYFSIMVFLSLYGIHRYYLIYLYYKYYKKKINISPEWPSDKSLPFVTIQLPVFNEMYVVERLIDSVCSIDYPYYEVQVLDDSTDETTDIIKNKISEWKAKGRNIYSIHRDSRAGFKAGALANGLEKAKGEFVLIFDADFVPQKDLITKMIPSFYDEKVGMVQVRWGHMNPDYSLLTKLQAMFLDAHFMIEHTARNRSGHFFNFNGTAGMWRKKTILDAGGWQHDTLTEDLDLSYRAQLKGWRFVFLPEVVCPAELPVELNAFKTQQHRWSKGSIQTGKKVLPKIWRSDLPFSIKFESTMHLFANLGYVLTVVLALLIFPSLMARGMLGWKKYITLELAVFAVIIISMGCYFTFSQREIYGKKQMKYKYLPSLLIAGIGISLNNSLAAIEGFVNKHSSFQRTAKYKIEHSIDNWWSKKYTTSSHSFPVIEMLFTLYMLVSFIFAVKYKMWGTIPFILLFFFGYSYISTLSLIHAAKK